MSASGEALVLLHLNECLDYYLVFIRNEPSRLNY